MSVKGVRVVTIGKRWNLPNHEVHHVDDTAGLFGVLATFKPDVIVTSTFIPGPLNLAPFEMRKRWIHPDQTASDEMVAQAIENCYASNLWGEHQYAKDNPLVSIYSGAYNTGDHLREAYQSLKDQTYTNWEWVVVDDASTDGTWERLQEMAREDGRVRPFRNALRSGKVGAVKDRATRLCKGIYLIEFDHDDILVDTAVQEVRTAFDQNPDVGMVYTNCSNFFEGGQGFQYWDDEFWKGRNRWTEYRGKKYLELLIPDIYGRFGPNYWDQYGWFLTVGPHHVRAFRASTFRELGGYNPELPVADDWDLFARFFLRSKCHKIDKMLYFQRIKDNWKNTTFTRNQDIQDHLELGRNRYRAEFDTFNKKRLGQTEKPAEDEVLLTICVPAIPSRMKTSLMEVISDLFKQAEGKPVEVYTFLDNKARNLSEKRNAMIASAKGRFITFVDDDDQVEPDYVDQLLEAIRKDPDADCVVFDVLVEGADPQPKVCKYGVAFEDRNAEDAYYRRPNHVMAWRAEISRKHLYKKELSAINEDFDWAARAVKDLKKEARISKVLYHYKYNAAETTQVHSKESREHTRGKKLLDQVSYVVPTAFKGSPVKACLESIRKWSPGSEIILVANGCQVKKSIQKLADKVVQLETNIGFAAGSNRGAMEATRSTVCFLNDDACFVDETPKKLVEAIEGRRQIVAPYSNRAKPPQGDIARENVPSGDAYPSAVVGLCMMMPVSLFRILSGFDTRLNTWEDDDFCARAAARNVLCKVVGGTYVEHERHATFKALGMDVQKVMAENGELFRKTHPKIHVIVIAKNEEKAIGDFFRQFHPVTRNFFVLDTGSTDGTIAVAQAAGAAVESAPFTDFAAARNMAMERFGGGADWIIMLDPDERLDVNTIGSLRETLSRTSHDILLAPLDAIYPDKSRRAFVAKAFAWRNKPDIVWVFKVHEKLIGSERQALVANGKIEHLIELHEDGRRQAAEGMYQTLMANEPYFVDPSYKERMREKWPILDYDRMDDDRISKIYLGPLVSVVVPTYKRGRLLRRAIKSALEQDYVNLEIVVVGDKCPEMMRALPKDPRVRGLNLPKNHGAGGAVPRNYSIMLGAGNLIAYLDDDNAWKKDHLSSLYHALRSSGASFAMSSMEVNGKDMGFTEPKFQGIDTSCLLHYRDLVRREGWWKSREEAEHYAHDWEFVSRWLKKGESWVATRKPTLIYNAETSGQKEFLEAQTTSK